MAEPQTEAAGQTLLDVARSYLVGYQFSILPIGQGKRPPKGFRWRAFEERQPNTDEIEKWFSRPDVTGLAVICGKVSNGLVVRDFDAAGAYERWAAEHPDLAKRLPTAKTGRGFHVYFRNGLEKTEHYSDGEVHGSGYCLLPPSPHVSGTVYKWVVPLPEDGGIPKVEDLEAAGLIPVTRNTQTESVTRSIRSIRSIGEYSSNSNGFTVEDVIKQTLPTREGERNRRVFELARGLMALMPKAEFRELKPIVREWHRQALPYIGTKPFDETWDEFGYGWKRVKHPWGQKKVKTMAKELLANSELPAEAAEYEQVELRRLVHVCRELQLQRKGESFCLSAEDATELVGLDPARDRMKVWRWLTNLLVNDGLIEVVKTGNQAMANQYRYLGKM